MVQQVETLTTTLHAAMSRLALSDNEFVKRMVFKVARLNNKPGVRSSSKKRKNFPWKSEVDEEEKEDISGSKKSKKTEVEKGNPVSVVVNGADPVTHYVQLGDTYATLGKRVLPKENYVYFERGLPPSAIYGSATIGENVEHVHMTTLVPTDNVVQIFVKTLTGMTLSFHIDLDQNSVQLMLMIIKSQGIPFEQQQLIFDGKKLDPHVPLSKYGLTKESTVHLILRLRGGMFHESSATEEEDNELRKRADKLVSEIPTAIGYNDAELAAWCVRVAEFLHIMKC